MSGYWTQYSNCGLEHPDAVAEKWIVEPTTCDVLAGAIVAEEHGGGGLTTRLTLAVWVRLPLAPVMVSG